MRNRILAILLCLAVIEPGATRPAVGEEARSRDFDFLFGTWKTHIRTLKAGVGWTTIDGIVSTRKIWNGKANLEEIEAPTNTGHFEGMTLRLYDPGAKQWNLYWANSKDGTVGPPSVGVFHAGRGTFYSHELIDGVATFVRQVYYDATPSSYKFEQSLSHDAGKTWEPNFVASLTRANPGSAVRYPDPTDEPAQQHGFDWQFGLWRLNMHRLLHALTSQAAWTDLNGTVNVEKLWNGRANLAEIVATGPASHLEILALRLYLPQSQQWTNAFANSSTGQLTAPMYGTFKGGRGVFYDQEDYNGKTVWDRFAFFDGGPNNATDIESLSEDAGKTWVRIFYNVHTRILSAAGSNGRLSIMLRRHLTSRL